MIQDCVPTTWSASANFNKQAGEHNARRVGQNAITGLPRRLVRVAPSFSPSSLQSSDAEYFAVLLFSRQNQTYSRPQLRLFFLHFKEMLNLLLSLSSTELKKQRAAVRFCGAEAAFEGFAKYSRQSRLWKRYPSILNTMARRRYGKFHRPKRNFPQRIQTIKRKGTSTCQKWHHGAEAHREVR